MHEGAEEAKRSARILDVLTRYGIATEKAGRQHKARCPFHDDSTPSLSVDPVKNVWHCFGCDKGGSVIDFIMLKEGLDFKEAVARLLVDGRQVRRGSDVTAPPSPPAAARREPVEPAKSAGVDPKLIQSVVAHYEKTLAGSDAKGLDYLKRRGLADPPTLKAFQVGYVNGSLKSVLPASAVELSRPDFRLTLFVGC